MGSVLEASASTDEYEATNLFSAFQCVRARTEALCEPLAVDDYGVQPMDDASPPKWHLAHTTWFFETFLLKPYLREYRTFHPRFEYLFNSYYNAVGEQYPRPKRGLMSRPTLSEVMNYRAHVDASMEKLLTSDRGDAVTSRTILGLHHEEQHEELIVTDLKYNLGNNPLHPPYHDVQLPSEGASAPLSFLQFAGGMSEIGSGDVSVGPEKERFCFDNETPRHRVWLEPYALADRLVTSGEYLEFVRDGGYTSPQWWLSDGWTIVRHEGWRMPLYWIERDGELFEYTLSGLRRVDPNAPVAHVSFYEADAFARWSGARLPSEAEWESATGDCDVAGNLMESGWFHPVPKDASTVRSQAAPAQMFGDVWEWTATSYGPYPGYAPLAGALGEYNGKFMSNQMVLRGGSCVTAPGHV
ncbi:MAG: ergothioneine biosynthesis protein EgtB, partial [Gammaproteobacteria bacterium]